MFWLMGFGRRFVFGKFDRARRLTYPPMNVRGHDLTGDYFVTVKIRKYCSGYILAPPVSEHLLLECPTIGMISHSKGVLSDV